MQYYIVILCLLYIEVAFTYYLNLSNYFKPLLLIPLLLIPLLLIPLRLIPLRLIPLPFIPKTPYKSYELRYTIGFTIVSSID